MYLILRAMRRNSFNISLLIDNPLPRNAMILIQCALFCEAKPLIRELGLTKIDLIDGFEVYRKSDTCLIISGIGKIKAAIAATALLSKLEHEIKHSVFINIGVCGASPKFELGAVVLPVSISSASIKRKFFPDLLLKHSFIEADMFTSDLAVGDPAELLADCVDMEGYGFYQAANYFLKTSQIYCLKIVSDFCDLKSLDKDFVSGLISARLNEILEFTNSIHAIQIHSEVLEVSEQALLQQINKDLKLTEYQKLELHQLAVSFKVRAAGNLNEVCALINKSPQNKQEAKNFYLRIQDALRA